jgi:hypothetical protein
VGLLAWFFMIFSVLATAHFGSPPMCPSLLAFAVQILLLIIWAASFFIRADKPAWFHPVNMLNLFFILVQVLAVIFEKEIPYSIFELRFLQA